MRFELTILGSGSALPVSNRHTTAQVLNVLERFFLIDCGEGAQNRLRQYKIPFGKINHVLISHMHGDHFYGIFGLLSTFGLLGREKTLHIHAPEPLKDVINKVFLSQYTKPTFDIKYHPLNYREEELIFSDKRVDVYSFPLKHSIPVCGFLFQEKERPRKIRSEFIEPYQLSIAELNALKAGEDIYRNNKCIKNEDLTYSPFPPRSYAFITDTLPVADRIDLIKGTDVIYHESTFLAEDRKLAKKTYHSTTIDAADTASRLKSSLLLLGHYSARYESQNDFMREASEKFTNSFSCIDGDKIIWPQKDSQTIDIFRNGEKVFSLKS